MVDLPAHRQNLTWKPSAPSRDSYTLTELQVVFGLATLKRLPEEIERRRQYAEIYRKRLGHTDLELLEEPQGYTFIYFKFPSRRT